MRLLFSPPVLALLWAATLAHAGEQHAQWERTDVGVGETSCVAVTVDPAVPQRIFAASPRTLSESADGGRSWRERFRVPGGVTVSGLAVEGARQPTILLATDRGLYGSFDGGVRWSRVFRAAGAGTAQCTSVAFHPLQRGTALLGTRGGLFRTSDHGRHWTAVSLPLAAHDVIHFAFDPHNPARLYLLTAEGLFVGNLTNGQWQQRFRVAQAEAADPDATETSESNNEDVEPEAPPNRLTAVALDPQRPATLYLAGTRGLTMSRDGGTSWERVTRLGLASPSIARLVLYRHSPLVIYAATARGVARYEPERGRWQLITQGLATTQVRDLAAVGDQLWAATDRGLYRAQVVPDPFSDSEPPSPRELLSNFTYEPTIADVREAAIRYAEVHPNKITWWRRQAALRALLPTIDFGMDRNRNRDAHVDEGAFPKFQILQTEDRDAKFNISVKWELGNLIWNGDQTSIDVRSKLMVQLRNDIVDEVTRTYFERRRLQVLLLTNPPSDQQELLEKELRLRELTALIDGVTGGYFSHEAETYGTK